MPVVTLENRALLEITGTEAAHFLQNVLTTDLDSIPDGVARPGALLTPQGKIMFDYLVFREGPDRFFLDCRNDIATEFAKRLTFYRLRAKAAIEVKNQPVAVAWEENDSSVSGFDSSASETDSGTVRDGRFIELVVTRHYGRLPQANAGLESWTSLRIEHGIAESGTDYELGDAFPHDVLFDQMDGVGLRKGCYIGQEVVSRMQHRGTARRRVLVAEGRAPLDRGADILADGKPVGRIGSAVRNRALAIARIDRVKTAADEDKAITANGVELHLSIPSWARFTFPQGAAEEG
jgi:folate-binding protein YgfZ